MKNVKEFILNKLEDLSLVEVREETLLETLPLDSLDVTDLTVTLESEYGIDLSDLDNLDEFGQVSDFIKYIENLVGE